VAEPRNVSLGHHYPHESPSRARGLFVQTFILDDAVMVAGLGEIGRNISTPWARPFRWQRWYCNLVDCEVCSLRRARHFFLCEEQLESI